MERLDNRAIERIKGPAWDPLRLQFESIHNSLIATSPYVFGTLTTIYVKYTNSELNGAPFAVIWIKKSTELVIGLSLPKPFLDSGLISPPNGFKYNGLTGYVVIKASGEIPKNFTIWSNLAYEFALKQFKT